MGRKFHTWKGQRGNTGNREDKRRELNVTLRKVENHSHGKTGGASELQAGSKCSIFI